MSAARRRASTSSLAAGPSSAAPNNLSDRSLDFCNAFWGQGDSGVEVLLARMRGASRTIDELRAFWKERAAIEEDYAKRLSRLAKQVMGRDEIGELKNSLDTVRVETDRQATAHINLAQQLRQELEGPASAYATRQAQFKRGAVAIVEKEFKNKQLQEQAVAKAREKYESDCMRINSYTAQSTLIQGKELEKVQLKLDRAIQTVGVNERDYANFARALQATVDRWENDWRAFCDACQDLEEERLEFMKDNVWSYANAVSTVCVADDESCEKVRMSLEQLEPERDMENFVREYGTGNEIPNPPKFISYSNPEAAMAASRPTPPRYAHFSRSSSRRLSMAEATRPPPPEEEPVSPGMAGFGAGGGAPVRNGEHERSGTMDSQHRPASDSPVNGMARSPANSTQRPISSPSSAVLPVEPDRYALAVGNNAYKVYPERDPQSASSSSAPAAPPNANVGAANDPLAKQMEDLRISAATTGSMRRNNSVNRPGHRNVTSPGSVSSSASGPSGAPSSFTTGASNAGLAAPISSNAMPNRDYRNSAELVVGGPPPTSRPTSPAGPPVAAHMIPPPQLPSSSLPVEDVVYSYAQALPGERRAAISRSNSPQPMISHTRSQSLGQNLIRPGSAIERPRSREGFAGIGAGSRSPSPAPGSSGGSLMTSSGSRIPDVLRAGSPGIGAGHGNLGISLDETGRVTEDLMAEQYRLHQQQQHQQQQQAVPPPPPIQPVQSMQSMHSPYGGVPSPYHQTHQRQGSLSTPVPPSVSQPHPPYAAPPPAPYGQPPPAAYETSHRPWGYPQTAQQYANAPPLPPPAAAGVQQPPVMAYTAAPLSSNGVAYHPTGHYDPNMMRRSPSPIPPQIAPTGQYIDGHPVLFYVKALYDYEASVEEEFDFQAGDVIAVTSTPEDGWWTGVLLDDSRRIPGRTVFPSNFVCLF